MLLSGNIKIRGGCGNPEVYKNTSLDVKIRAANLPKWWVAENTDTPSELDKFINKYQPGGAFAGDDFREALIKVLNEYNNV